MDGFFEDAAGGEEVEGEDEAGEGVGDAEGEAAQGEYPAYGLQCEGGELAIVPGDGEDGGESFACGEETGALGADGG